MASTQIKLLALVVCLTSNLAAWQRTALEDCQQAKKSCKKDSSECNNDHEVCKKNAPRKDRASFEKELSPYARTQFMRLSPDKQERAMDYAHDSAISPDDAVAKVSCECKKIK